MDDDKYTPFAISCLTTAISLFKENVQLNPTNDELASFYFQSALLEVEEAIQRKQNEKIKLLSEFAAYCCPHTIEGYQKLGMLYLRIGDPDYYVSAKILFETILQADPNNVLSIQRLEEVRSRLQEAFEEKIAQLKSALQQNGSKEKINNLVQSASQFFLPLLPNYWSVAEIYLYLKDAEQACNFLNTALSFDDKNPHTLYLLGEAYQLTQAWDEAKHYYTMAISYHHHDPDAIRQKLVDIHTMQGEMYEVNAIFQAAKKMNGSETLAKTVKVSNQSLFRPPNEFSEGNSLQPTWRLSNSD
jgi:tetratricopeptide (TPR) repeat protein